MNICFMGIHQYHDTFRDVLTFGQDGGLLAATAPTCRCKNCGKFKNPDADRKHGFMAAMKSKQPPEKGGTAPSKE